MELKVDYKRRYSNIYAKIKHDAEVAYRCEKRWVERIRNLTSEERAKWLHKLSVKHNGNATMSNSLYNILYTYCLRYCPEVYPHHRKGLDMFYDDQAYLIDDTFIFNAHEDIDGVFHYTLCKIGFDEVVPLKIRDNNCSLVGPDGETMCTFNDYLTFLDICAQIKRKQSSGYKFLFNGKCISVDKNGTLQEYPNGFFDKSLNLLCELV